VGFVLVQIARNSFCLYATPPHNLGLYFEPLAGAFELVRIAHGRFLVHLVATPSSQILQLESLPPYVEIGQGYFLVCFFAKHPSQILGLDFQPR
jgi:hypothetical protein